MLRRASITALAIAIVTAVAIMVVPAIGAKKRKEKLDLTALSGKEEVKLNDNNQLNSGDKDGYGAALLRAKTSKRLCFRIIANRIGDKIEAAHIHKGVFGKNGDIVLLLMDGTDQTGRGCVRPKNDAEKSTIKDVFKHPEDYYVNVHTAAFPDGAIRGQLTKGR
jgi:CHRD domain-containing protein